MGNTNVKPHPKPRNKKQVHWKAAARPPQPGKPHLISETESTPDLVTIRWEKPLNDGGAPIFGYLVEHRRTGSPHWVRSTPLLVQTQELTISGLEPGWRYQFRVSAENAVGISDPSELSETITVTLQRSAVTAPRFTEELKETTTLENEKAEFIVHFLGQPAPKVCWFKDSFEIFSSRRIRIITDGEKSILTIHQSSLSDEGEIKCTATNRAGHVSTKAKLIVEAPPNIRLPRQYEDGLLFELGEVIRLKVSVAGRPTPLVFWSHNGESLRNNDHCEISHSEQSSTLKINEANREDRGEYHIKAVNKLGETNQSFLVTVTDKPSPPGRARVVMALGRSVTLSWSTPHDDGGCKIGNYIVEYYRLGWNVWLKAATSRQLTTMLGDLIEGSEYKFRVKAESPYGVSDPGEESDVVFVPDPKRGILQPSTRGLSQQRDIEQQPVTPVARRKNKQRSLSSPRIENPIQFSSNEDSLIDTSQIPKRPERAKVKSPPKTPEASPMANKRIVDTKANKKLFELSDRSSMARDLAYGSPDIKLKKDSQQIDYLNTYSSGSEKSRTPSPTGNKKIDQADHSVEVKSSSENTTLNESSTSSLDKKTFRTQRNKNDNLTGSSEFMLVLYPGENDKDQFDSEYDSIPPPMSLSAPELGSEATPFHNLRNSASSSELLHERAMMRIYQAAEAEEKEIERRLKSLPGGKDIPKIQINSKDDHNLEGLYRQSSFRRKLSFGGACKESYIHRRRHSLKNPSELKEEVLQDNLRKFKLSTEEKKQVLIERLRSKSVENEERVFEELRLKMSSKGKSSKGKHEIRIADEEKWDEDYSSSTDESESEDDYKSNEVPREYYHSDEEDTETYHPEMATKQSTKNNEPFEILTVRKDPPSPDFVPKPILKRTEHEEQMSQNTLSAVFQPRNRSSSPIPRGRSHSLAETSITLPSIKKPTTEGMDNHPRKRSFSLLPQDEINIKSVNIPQIPSVPEIPKPYSIMHSISAAATISGITAASIVIPSKLLDKQKDTEEAKVVIDHYGDIVKSYGSRRKSNPQAYLDRDSLKRAAEIDEIQTNVSKGKDEITNNSQQSKTVVTTKGYISGEEKNAADVNHVTSSGFDDSSIASQYKDNRLSKDQNNCPDNSSNYPFNTAVTAMSRTAYESPIRPLKIDIEKSKASTLDSYRGRKTAASPLRTTKTRKTSVSPSMQNRNKSVKSLTTSQRRPMLREIMTQTSEGLMDSFINDSRTPSPTERSRKQEELIAQAGVKVHRFVDYTTDLAMFVVACWLYLFQNELMAIPVLLVMVYRQLQDEISKRIPKWILRRLRRKQKK
ncbi:unnamed protein product [Phaedon cochleariae]|uniref:Uncharacterized protein n=1 Tax=Phaedon cochleariae TaxID=80249 RepID=A0A9N9X7M8_PHACE|nr:unnamed protein product [Phaedon cochleariae]